LTVLDLVLRLPGTQRLGQVVPELEQPIIQHHQPTPDVARTLLVEIEGARRRVGVLRFWAIALTIEKLHCYQGVEEITNAARMQAQLLAQVHTSHLALAEFSEHAKLNSGK